MQNGVISNVAKVASLTPWTANVQIGWGEGCEIERKGGRAGICNFKIGQLHMARQLGLATLDKLSERNVAPATQIFYVEGDEAVWNKKIRELYDALPSSAQKSKCVYKADVGHSCEYRDGPRGCSKAQLTPRPPPRPCTLTRANTPVLSRFDTPDANKYWLLEISARLASVLTNTEVSYSGRTGNSLSSGFLKTSGTNAAENNDPSCELSCEGELPREGVV